MKYVIFINLDEILWSSEDKLEIKPNDLKEIMNGQNLGVEIVVCTKENNLDKLIHISKTMNVQFAIYDSGKFIRDFKNNKNILEKKLLNESNEFKEKALEIFCKEKGISLENVMTIGINDNYISKIEKIGFSYAMANSESTFKKISKYHTSSSEQGGLGEAIIDYLYRNKLSKN